MKYYRQFQQDEYLNENVFKGKADGYFVDIGGVKALVPRRFAGEPEKDPASGSIFEGKVLSLDRQNLKLSVTPIGAQKADTAPKIIGDDVRFGTMASLLNGKNFRD